MFITRRNKLKETCVSLGVKIVLILAVVVEFITDLN
jgi:hypothetical protein